MADKKYRVICYMRIEPEDQEPLTLAEANVEAENSELMQPENIFTVELID